MALYTDLTQADKDLLGAFERNTRGWINQVLAKGIIQARALDAARTASGGVQSIIDSLDVGEIVPNSSGIAGAQELTKAEWNTLIGGLSSFLSTYDTLATRRNIAKAAGPTAGL